MTFIFEDIVRPEQIRKERIRNRVILAVVIAVILGGILFFVFRNYPEERAVKRFVAALEQGNYQEAYRIWQPTSTYSYNAFLRDWGPNGEYGKIKSFKFVRSRSVSNGVIATIELNGKEARLWVDRDAKAITFAPEQVIVMPQR